MRGDDGIGVINFSVAHATSLSQRQETSEVTLHLPGSRVDLGDGGEIDAAGLME